MEWLLTQLDGDHGPVTWVVIGLLVVAWLSREVQRLLRDAADTRETAAQADRMVLDVDAERTAVATLGTTIAHLETQVSHLRDQVAHLERQNADLRARLEMALAASERFGRLEADNTSLRARVADLERQVVVRGE